MGKSNVTLTLCFGALNFCVQALYALLEGIFNNVFQCVLDPKPIWIYFLYIARKWKKSLLFIMLEKEQKFQYMIRSAQLQMLAVLLALKP